MLQIIDLGKRTVNTFQLVFHTLRGQFDGAYGSRVIVTTVQSGKRMTQLAGISDKRTAGIGNNPPGQLDPEQPGAHVQTQIALTHPGTTLSDETRTHLPSQHKY